jgi:cell division septation protein DedD
MSGRARGRSEGMGWMLRITLVASGAAVVCLVFTLGVVTGRHWVRPAADAVAEPARKAAPAKRSALVDGDVERPRAGSEKLTFYQTLTAPLAPGPTSTKPLVVGRAPSESSAPAARPPAHEAVAPRDAGPSREPAAAAARPPAPAAPEGAPPARSGGGFSVQVGAFKNRQQADAVHRDLRTAGFEAFVSTLGTAGGETRFRVRVGPFPSRAEAERAAERMRAARSLPTYVAAD